jgi:hypothetical protein
VALAQPSQKKDILAEVLAQDVCGQVFYVPPLGLPPQEEYL